LKELQEKQQGLLDENDELRAKSGQLEEIVQKKDQEVEEIKKSYSKDKQARDDPKEISLNIQEDLDDVKVKSFLEVTYVPI
jgi:hypothetical protein